MLTRFLFVPFVCSLLLGCGFPTPSDPGNGAGVPPLLDKEKPHKGEAVSEEEKMVAEFVQASKRQDIDEKVAFIRWGPHD